MASFRNKVSMTLANRHSGQERCKKFVVLSEAVGLSHYCGGFVRTSAETRILGFSL